MFFIIKSIFKFPTRKIGISILCKRQFNILFSLRQEESINLPDKEFVIGITC